MKKISAIIIFTATFLLVIGFVFFKSTNAGKEEVFSMKDVLAKDFHTPDFDVKDTKLTINQLILKDGVKNLTISEEHKEKLINEIKQFELVNPKEDEFFSFHEGFKQKSLYSVDLTINTFYEFIVDSKTNLIIMHGGKTVYKIKNGDKFFAIINEIKTTPTN